MVFQEEQLPSNLSFLSAALQLALSHMKEDNGANKVEAVTLSLSALSSWQGRQVHRRPF